MQAQSLRPYQARTMTSIDEAWESGARTIAAVGPTGAGKSRIAREQAARAKNPIIISHTRGLRDQLKETVGGTSVTIQELLAIEKTDGEAMIELFKEYDLCILDECHHYSGTEEWEKVHTWFAHARLLGFTATPERGDGRPLAGHYEKMVVIASYSELTRGEFLVPCTTISPDPRTLNQRTKRVSREHRVDVLSAYREHCAGLRTIIFCETRADAREVAKSLDGIDVSAAVIDGETSDALRDAAFEQFKRGELSVLVNVDVLTEGIDLPCTEAIILSQSCLHCGAYLQIAGRGLRSSPGKSELILVDLTGCTLEFGAPHIDRTYSLTGLAISTQGGNTALCSDCFRAFGFQGAAPEEGTDAEETPTTDSDTDSLNLKRELLCAEHLEKARTAVSSRQARRKLDWRLTDKERKLTAKNDEKWLSKFALSTGMAVWVCYPHELDDGTESASPCPHCARERPRGKRDAAIGLTIETPAVQQAPTKAEPDEPRRRDRIQQVCQGIRQNQDPKKRDLSKAFDLWRFTYPQEAPITPAEFDEAVPFSWKTDQANLIKSLVASGDWAKGTWRFKYYAIFPSKSKS